MKKSVRAALLLAGMSALFVPSASAQRSSGSADARLKALYEAEWAWRQKEFARVEGEDGSSDPGPSLPRVDEANQLRRLAYWQKTLAELEKIPVGRLSSEGKINAAVFRTSLEGFIEDGRFREWEMPFNSDSSFWAGLNPRQGFRTAEEYRRYIGRMRDIPRYFDEQMANMRAGLRRGFSVPRATLAGRDASIAPYAATDVAKNPFYAAFARMPATIPAAEQARLRAEGETAIREAVAPAYTKLLGFFRSEYVPQARSSIAAQALPDGNVYYAAQIREYTTLDLSADQIHEIGLKEVARIQAEMQQVMRESGFKGSFPEFLKFLRTDPRFYAKTPDELMGFSSYVAKRVDGKLKDYFGFLPRYRFTILPVPDEIAPFYTAGRGGLDSCLMNTWNLPTRPLYNITALTLHECAPGHSFQAALALEQPERPAFRRQTYFSGYGEGWGLYTEWLGVEMGIYRTPYDHFGRLTYEMWRAARLVIDTGLHSKGWSRQQAIDYLASHTALSQHEVTTEVDRYISWPGQALAYKLGEMTIRRLRAEAEAKLGTKFDPRYFHDAILQLGSVPLPVLEQHIREFIAGGGKNPHAPRKAG
jgi:uncharacterized protein (DUF885 family)